MKTNIEQAINYDVSGGDAEFEGVVSSGKDYISFQIFYSNLNQADHTIRIQECLDGVNYVDSVDAAGDYIEIVLDNTLTNDIIKIVNFNTNNFRCRFIEGTSGTGTIDRIKVMTE